MYCSKCGKEINDDSIFCYSCGSKVEIKEKQDSIDTTPSLVIEKENTSDTKLPEQKPPHQEDKKIVSSSFLDSYKKLGWGYGWLILLSFYGYGLSIYSKKNLHYVTITSMIIPILGIVVLLMFYFSFRKFLIKKNFWKGHIGSSSCLSAIVSYIVVGSLVGGSIGFIGGYEKRKEINQFNKDYVKQTENLRKQELVFMNSMMVSPKTTKETDNFIKTLDKYKLFLREKRTHSSNLINFFLRMKSMSKNKITLDQKIKILQDDINNIFKDSEYGVEMLKLHHMTGEEKYYDQYNQILIKQETLKIDLSKQITDIYNLL